MSASYLRCSHCRGFYELALSHCRYCGKDVPMKEGSGGGGGSAKVFVDRATCRAIQIAEYEQLPEEAHKDCFRPAPEMLDKLCGCLHCNGPEGGFFEAVEMRWMVNEQMWACPCTTCGGRGFTFDIHLVEPMWQCECGHWYSPPEGDRRHSAAKCPKCGSKEASGWFDDEEDSEEYTEEELEAEFGPVGKREDVPNEALPWDDDEVAASRKESEDEEEDGAFAPEPWRPPEREKLKDDIDYPHAKRERVEGKGEGALGDDDIPW